MSFPGTQDLSNDGLRRLVEQLLDEAARLGERVAMLEEEEEALREENTRLKGHKGRSSLKPSSMEEATGGAKPKAGRKKARRARRRFPVVNEEHKLSADVPAGSRFKGYDDFVVQDLRIEGRIIRKHPAGAAYRSRVI
jgi:anti-sigma factor RsiW